MTSQNRITLVLRKNMHTLKAEYGVKSLYLFGSQASGRASKKSDIDLLVEFDNDKVGLFKFMKLKFFLEKILKSNVDLVTQEALMGWMKDSIDKEKIRVA